MPLLKTTGERERRGDASPPTYIDLTPTIVGVNRQNVTTILTPLSQLSPLNLRRSRHIQPVGPPLTHIGRFPQVTGHTPWLDVRQLYPWRILTAAAPAISTAAATTPP
jgi:hypothetical protein